MALLDWQNLIFLLPMLAALAYTLLMAAGLGFGEHGIEVDHMVPGHMTRRRGGTRPGHGPRHRPRGVLGEPARPVRVGQGSPPILILSPQAIEGKRLRRTRLIEKGRYVVSVDVEMVVPTEDESQLVL